MKKKKILVLTLVLIIALCASVAGCQKEQTAEHQKDEQQESAPGQETDKQNQVADVHVKSVLPIQQEKNWLMLFELSEKLAGIDKETTYQGVVIEVSDGLEVHRYEDIHAYRNSGGRLAVEIPYGRLFPGDYLNNGTYQLTVKAGTLQSANGENYQLLTDYELKHLGNNVWGEKESTKVVAKHEGDNVTVQQVTATYQEWEPRWYFELYFSDTVSGEKYVTNYKGLRMLITRGTQVKEYALGNMIGNDTDVMTGPDGRMTVLIYSEDMLPGGDKLNASDNWSITFQKGVVTSDAGNLRINSDYTLKYNGDEWVVKN